MKTLSNVLIVLALLYGVTQFALKQTDGFSIWAVASQRPYNAHWECRALSPEEQQEVHQALTQKYTYYGCGGQSFVFFSEDGNYVVKFFKQRLFQPPRWPRVLPYIAKKAWKRLDKLERDFASYRIAFDELQDETGLLFVHLNKTEHLPRSLSLIDRLRIEHHIDPNAFDFVIQKKAELIYDRIAQQMAQHQIEEARASVRAALGLIAHRCQKGYHDRDPNLRTNCGFIGNKAVKIDVGRFLKKEEMRRPEIVLSETLRIGAPFKEWLSLHYPELTTTYDEEIACLERSLF